MFKFSHVFRFVGKWRLIHCYGKTAKFSVRCERLSIELKDGRWKKGRLL